MKKGIKELIANSFERKLTKSSFDKINLDTIAKELKISKKTIYIYYKNKDEIYYHIMHTHAAKFCKKLEKKTANMKKSRLIVKEFIHQVFLHAKSRRKHFPDPINCFPKFKMAQLAYEHECSDLFINIIRRGVKNKEFSKINLNISLIFILSILSNAIELDCKNPKMHAEQEATKAIFKLLK